MEKGFKELAKQKGGIFGDKLRAEKLMEILAPCLTTTDREPHWQSERYNTTWGTKSYLGMVAVICRVMYEDQ